MEEAEQLEKTIGAEEGVTTKEERRDEGGAPVDGRQAGSSWRPTCSDEGQQRHDRPSQVLQCFEVPQCQVGGGRSALLFL